MPSIFISYSWDSAQHKEWVLRLATELQTNGVEVMLDVWDAKPGMDLPKFMESAVSATDFVLLVCTPSFAAKANAGEGGVGYEKRIVTGDIYTGTDDGKYIPILRDGKSAEALPAYLKSKYYVDFRDESQFASSIEILLRHLHDAPLYAKPPLGPRPTFEEGSGGLGGSATASDEESRTNFQSVYRFARSSAGFNYSMNDAKQFALRWVSEYSDRDFDLFKAVYEFARSSSGFSYSMHDARQFALQWVSKCSDYDFDSFKAAYKFARSPTGLSHSMGDARRFALKWVEEHGTWVPD